MFFSQIGQGSESQVLQLLYLALFIFFMFYGQKFQTWTMLREIGNAVSNLKTLKNNARQITITVAKESGNEGVDPSPRIDHFLEYFSIMPTSLDPAGIVPKIQHLMDFSDQRFKDEVKLISPMADEVKASNIEGALVFATELNSIYRQVNHLYLLGKKTMSLYVIMQVQMQIPLIMQIADSYSQAVKACADGQPIGDGAGALVAGKLMFGHEKVKIAKETVMAETQLENRRVLVLKSEGPGCTVGQPGEGIKKLVEENKGKIASVIMIDGMGKYEGEKSGETSEGSGAAIGGIGVEAFVIEEITMKHKLPIHAVIIKETIEESLAPMTKAIYSGVDVAIARVKRLIRETSKEGDTIIVAGIGNTIGIGQ